jgi:tetratricopeptide (TPR) repeat protein
MKHDFSSSTWFLKKYKNVLLGVLSACIVACMLISPLFNQTAGNFFFGEVSKLYNVTLAQFFFKNAAYPIFGRPAEYAHYQLSRTYFIQGDLYTALAEARKELEVFPYHTRSYYILGLTFGYLNREKEAIEAFTVFIQANPNSWAARNDKAWLQFRIGDIDGALATIGPITSDIGNPWIQNTYGTLLLNKKRYNEAREAFLHAKQITDSMTEEEWGVAYPGNDPRIYATGLNAVRTSIRNNLALLNEQ